MKDFEAFLMKFLNLTDNPVDNEIAQLQAEIDDLRYRVNNWALLPSAVEFWADIIEKMEMRLNALQAGIDAKTTG